MPRFCRREVACWSDQAFHGASWPFWLVEGLSRAYAFWRSTRRGRARVQHRMTRRKKKKRVRNGQVSQPLVPYTEADFPNPHATDRRVGKSSQYQVLTRSDVLTEGTRKIKQNRGDAFLFCHDHGDAVPRARRVLSTNDLRKFQVWRQGNQAALRSTPA